MLFPRLSLFLAALFVSGEVLATLENTPGFSACERATHTAEQSIACANAARAYWDKRYLLTVEKQKEILGKDQMQSLSRVVRAYGRFQSALMSWKYLFGQRGVGPASAAQVQSSRFLAEMAEHRAQIAQLLLTGKAIPLSGHLSDPFVSRCAVQTKPADGLLSDCPDNVLADAQKKLARFWLEAPQKQCEHYADMLRVSRMRWENEAAYRADCKKAWQSLQSTASHYEENVRRHLADFYAGKKELQTETELLVQDILLNTARRFEAHAY